MNNASFCCLLVVSGCCVLRWLLLYNLKEVISLWHHQDSAPERHSNILNLGQFGPSEIKTEMRLRPLTRTLPSSACAGAGGNSLCSSAHCCVIARSAQLQWPRLDGRRKPSKIWSSSSSNYHEIVIKIHRCPPLLLFK